MESSGADLELRSADVLAGDDVARHVVRGGAQRAAGFATSNLVTAGGAVLLLRYLGVDDFGRYGTVMALVAILQGLTDAGLTMTASREMAMTSDPAVRRELLSHVLGLRIMLTGGGVLLAVAFAAVAGYGSQLVLGTLLAGTGIFLVSVQNAMLMPLLVELRNGRIALAEVLRQVALIVCFAALVVAGAGLTGFFAAQIVAAGVLFLATPLLLERTHFVAPRWSRERMRDIATIGLPVAVASVLGILYFRILVVLMSLLSDSPAQIGYYVTSARVIEIFIGLPTLLAGVIVPVLTVAARDDRARLDYVAARMTEMMALGGIATALVLGIAARPIVLVLGGQAYEPAIGVVQIQCVALVTIFITAAWSPALIGMGRTRALAACTGFGVVAVLAAGCALIPPYEAKGAAVAAVVADVLLCIVTYVAIRRAGPGRRLEVRTLLRIAIAAIAAIAVGFVTVIPDIPRTIIALAVFAGLALVLHAVPPEMLTALRSLRRRVSPG